MEIVNSLHRISRLMSACIKRDFATGLFHSAIDRSFLPVISRRARNFEMLEDVDEEVTLRIARKGESRARIIDRREQSIFLRRDASLRI